MCVFTRFFVTTKFSIAYLSAILGLSRFARGVNATFFWFIITHFKHFCCTKLVIISHIWLLLSKKKITVLNFYSFKGIYLLLRFVFRNIVKNK